MATLGRRRFLRSAGVGAVSAGFLAACSADDGAEVRGSDAASDASESDLATAEQSASVVYPFRDVAHQAGVAAPLASHGIVIGLDTRAESRVELGEALRALSDAAEQVMSGEPYESRPGGFPADDTGILGPVPGPTSTAIVFGFGDSLFDERFGLADRRPLELQRMPKFANDYLVRPERSHGDLALTISADTSDAAVHALRQLLRATRGVIVPRWQRQGSNSLFVGVRPGEAPMRNLMGFKDGTSNLDSADDRLMDDLVWVQAADDQPEWAIGGTYQVIRVIRMQTEFWDRTRLNEQEAIFGRHRDSGAPLGMDAETDAPDFGGDLGSHIARANPRTAGSERNLILRKGFNYSSGLDQNDQLDQGLIFMSFQRSLERGFITVQRRLDGEALEEYVRPLGGGFYFVPPAPADGEYLGERLLA